MTSGFDFALLALAGSVAYGAYETRRIRQIAQAAELSHQIIVMARGRLWARYPGARFDILTSPTFDLRQFSASLILYTLDHEHKDNDGAWMTLLKTRNRCSDVLEALEELQEKLAVHVIEHEDDIKRAFDEAISPKVRRAADLDYMIPPRKVPYIDRLDGRIITKCVAM